MGVSSLILLGFSLLVLLFFVALITPFTHSFIVVISRIIGEVGSSNMANAIHQALLTAHDNPNKVIQQTYSITLGEGYYYVGYWQSKTLLGVCPAGAFCVVYITPNTYDTQKVAEQLSKANATGLLVAKSNIVFQGKYLYVDKISGSEHNAGYLLYVGGIKKVTFQLVVLYDDSKKGEELTLVPLSGVDVLKTVNRTS